MWSAECEEELQKTVVNLVSVVTARITVGRTKSTRDCLWLVVAWL